MSSTIRYLETLAIHPNLTAGTAEELESLMDSLQIDASERTALLQGDVMALARLNGGRKQMAAIQFPGDDEPQREEEPQRDDDQPGEDEQEITGNRPDRLN